MGWRNGQDVDIGNVHLLNTSNAKISPATEGTLGGIEDELDGSTADGPLAVIANAARTYFSAVVNVPAGARTEIQGTPGSGKELWVFGYEFHANTGGSFTLESATTAKTGVNLIGANGGVGRDAPQADCPIFKCTANEALNVTTVTCTLDGVVNGFIVDV